jgi:hypothetical protein
MVIHFTDRSGKALFFDGDWLNSANQARKNIQTFTAKKAASPDNGAIF